jgi:hypothetical protein
VISAIGDAPTELREAVSVMVSELSTNALLHASGGFEVAVDRSDLTLCVSVSDRGDGEPVLQAPTFSEPHGRGLRIVAALSDEWGISATSDGKAVWFRISLQDATATASTGAVAGSTATASGGMPGSTPARLESPSTSERSTKADVARSHHRTSRRRSPGADRRALRCHRSDHQSAPDRAWSITAPTHSRRPGPWARSNSWSR